MGGEKGIWGVWLTVIISRKLVVSVLCSFWHWGKKKKKEEKKGRGGGGGEYIYIFFI